MKLPRRLAGYVEELGMWSRRKYRLKKEKQNSLLPTMDMFWGQDTVSTFRILEAQREYNKVLNYEEIFWKQRSKMHWLHSGDRNIKFFHRSATAQKKFQKLDMLLDEDNGRLGIKKVCVI